MKLKQDKFLIGSARMNPVRLAMVYPDCPIEGIEDHVCIYIVVGYGRPQDRCKYFKVDEAQENAECSKPENEENTICKSDVEWNSFLHEGKYGVSRY